MIKLTGRLVCTNSDETARIRRYLPAHTRLTKQEAGCLLFEVKETDDPLVWTVEELFESQESFDAHQARTKASVWGQETRTIAREYVITEVV
ncbi:putative quinol monooxygenase [Pantoea sp. KPR_PJ]|uniref:putative quinol monooxygenase n=1 Tax=Pantoea sp. KPR_PJ TaxID=2738375 RepID=UPI0035282EE6